MMARTNGNATDVEQRGPAVSTASHSPTRACTFVEVSALVVSTGRSPLGEPKYDGSDSPASLRQRAAQPAQESGHAVDTTARSRRSGRARRASAPAVPRVELRPQSYARTSFLYATRCGWSASGPCLRFGSSTELW